MSQAYILILALSGLFLIFCLALYLDYRWDHEKTARPRPKKFDSEIDDLFASYTSLNNDALDTYKALIDASFEASMMEQQHKKIEKKDPFSDFNFNLRR
jgi:hypothetical protein